MPSGLFLKKPLDVLLKEAEGEKRLRRVLGPLALTSFGIGCVIGTGIFVLTGVAAHDKAGPALILSFVVAGIACIFAALCYAEFASMVPIAGSAYTYAYATLGEIFAWIIGWDLVLEYTVAAASVAHGWSKYFQDFISIFNLHLPPPLSNPPIDFDPSVGHMVFTGTIMDLPAIFISLTIAAILIKGIKESSGVNTAMVLVKVSVVLFVIVVGAFFVRPENWRPFAPYGYTGVSIFGHTLLGLEGKGGEPLGMLAGAAMMFYAYIGFDTVSTQAEEARNPQRDVPIGIIASLIICTILYIGVTVVLTGMVSYREIDIQAPVSNAFAKVGLPWAQGLISIGALTGITSVLLVLTLGQTRILFAMARDGLVPMSFFGAVHSRFRTPWKSTILTGVAVAVMAGIIPLRILAELVNIGTLFAFLIVSIAVLVMRRIHPDARRVFRCPLVPLIPLLGIAFCLLLMFSLPSENWLRLFCWMAVGLLLYFFYGRKHSRIRNHRQLQAHNNSEHYYG
jgi:APA family basic amino acid/polyamine antiporter